MITLKPIQHVNSCPNCQEKYALDVSTSLWVCKTCPGKMHTSYQEQISYIYLMLTKYAEDKNIQSIYFKSHNFTLKEALMPNGLMPVIVERASQLSLECFNNDRFMGVENVTDKQGFVGFRTVPLSHFFEPAITTLTLTTIIDEAINLSKKHSVIASSNELDLSYLPNIHKKVPQTLNISIKQGEA